MKRNRFESLQKRFADTIAVEADNAKGSVTITKCPPAKAYGAYNASRIPDPALSKAVSSGFVVLDSRARWTTSDPATKED